MLSYLKRSFNKSWRSIKQHKVLFASLIILQIIFLVLFFWITLTNQMKIIQSAQGIIQPVQEANFDSDALQAGQPFMDDFLSVQKSYLQLKNSLINLAISLVALFLVLQAGLWILTHSFIKRYSWKNLGKMWLKFVGSSIVLFTPYFIASYYIGKNMILNGADLTSFSRVTQYLLAVLIIAYYLSIVAFGLINVSSWKKYVVGWFKVGFKKIHLTIITLIINLALLAGVLYLNYLAIMKTERLSWMLITIFISVLVLVTTRIFWTVSLQEIKDEKNNT